MALCMNGCGCEKEESDENKITTEQSVEETVDFNQVATEILTDENGETYIVIEGTSIKVDPDTGMVELPTGNSASEGNSISTEQSAGDNINTGQSSTGITNANQSSNGNGTSNAGNGNNNNNSNDNSNSNDTISATTVHQDTVQSNTSANAFANVVVFVQAQSTSVTNYYADKTADINDRWNTGDRSLTKFLSYISCGKFKINNIFPQYSTAQNQYICYSIPDSYLSGSSADAIVEKIAGMISVESGVKLDYNGDGCVDNLTLVLHKDNMSLSSQSDVMWPTKHTYSGDDKINGKLVRNYNIINTSIFKTDDINFNKYGVICHEFMHSLGYPDLYKGSSNGNDTPVGMWDIMASSSDYMSYPLTYLRYKLSGWLDISTVTTSGHFTLNAQDSASGPYAYILKTPMSSSEFFVVEYRKKGSTGNYRSFTMDSKIPLDNNAPGGLIIYRVNTNYGTLSNYAGNNAIYVFRPGVTNESACGGNASLFQSSLSAQSGRTSFGTSDMNWTIANNTTDCTAITYSNGANSGIVIKNVGSAGDSISFDIEFPSNSDSWSEEGSVQMGNGWMLSLATNSSGNPMVGYINNNTAILSSLKSGVWDKYSLSALGTVYSMKTVYYGGNQYIIYSNSSGVNVAKCNDGNISNIKNITGLQCNEIDAYGGTDGVYIATTYYSGIDSYINGYRMDAGGNISQIISDAGEGNAANPSITQSGSDIYIAYRAWKTGNQINVIKVSGTTITTCQSSGITGTFHRITASGGNVYLAVGSDNMAVYKSSSGGAFQKIGGEIVSGTVNNLAIAANGTRVFATCVNQTTGKTEVYQYNGNVWSKFGSQIDNGTLTEVEIQISGGKVVVAYIGNSNLYIKSKELG